MNRTKVDFFLGHEYEMWDFHIKPILAGDLHQFDHEGHRITIRLPSKPTHDGFDEDAAITCQSWRTSTDGRKYPTEYGVHRLRVEVEGKDSSAVPEDAIGRVDVSLFTQSQRERLNKAAARLSNVADSAFEHWIAVLRWQANNPFIRPPFGPNESISFGAYLFEKSTRKRFYSPGHMFVVQPTHAVSRASWKSAQKSLSAAEVVPIWHQYLSDAHTRIVSGDPDGAVLSLAIATETLIRRAMLVFLADPPDDAFLDIVDRHSVFGYLQRWHKFTFGSKRFSAAADIGKLQNLFSHRNRIMHSGKRNRLSIADCRSFFATVRGFIYEGDRYLRRVA